MIPPKLLKMDITQYIRNEKFVYNTNEKHTVSDIVCALPAFADALRNVHTFVFQGKYGTCDDDVDVGIIEPLLPNVTRLELGFIKLNNTPSLAKIARRVKHLRLEMVGLTELDFTLHPDITYIHLNHNPIHFVDLSAYKWLTDVHIAHCNLGEFPVLCPDNFYKTIDVMRNRITRIESFPRFVSEWLDVAMNDLVELPRVPVNIRNLTVFGNERLVRLPENITDCVHLSTEGMTLPASVVLTREQRRQFGLHHAVTPEIYRDAQNVHTSSIQYSLAQSVDALRRSADAHVPRTTTGHARADAVVARYERCDDVHGTLGVSYADILQLVWNRIHAHQDADQRSSMRARLAEEIIEGDDLCFVGRITRIVNALTGFFDDICVGVSATEQAHARVVAVLARHSLTPQTVSQASVETRRAVLSDLRAGLSEIIDAERVKEYIDALFDDE